MKRVSLVVTLALAAGLSAQAASAQTLKTVKDRGMLSCGVGQGLPGFSAPDDKGNWTGLDVDVCRAIAAAVFNDATKIKFVPLSAKDRFTALQSGEVDILARNTTWTSFLFFPVALSTAITTTDAADACCCFFLRSSCCCW